MLELILKKRNNGNIRMMIMKARRKIIMIMIVIVLESERKVKKKKTTTYWQYWESPGGDFRFKRTWLMECINFSWNSNNNNIAITWHRGKWWVKCKVERLWCANLFSEEGLSILKINIQILVQIALL